MRYIIHRKIQSDAPRGLRWVKAFLARFDVSVIGWVRIDFGREYKNARGQIYHKYRGLYGRCWYATPSNPTIRISCQVPGPFPCDILTRKRPVYRNADGSWPAGVPPRRGRHFYDAKTGRHWVRQYGRTTANDLDEGIVWIVAHEAFHWLRKTRQIPGRNNEIEADAFADARLAEFRALTRTLFMAPDRDAQLTLWGEGR